MSEVKRNSFNHRGFSLSYLDSAPNDADRPVVLLLHGFPDQAGMWLTQIESLTAAGYRCIAPDTLGCGSSALGKKVRDYNAVKIAGDHVALLDHLGVKKAHVAGHDWGAVIAWLMAGYFPERVSRLVVMSVGHPTAYGRSGYEQKLRGWYVLFFQFGGLSERLLGSEGRLSLRWVFGSHPQMDEVMERLSEPGRLKGALRIYRAALVSILIAKQPRVAVPTLGLWSEDDAFLTEEQMKASADWVDSDWRYEKLSGGHWMTYDHPEWTTQLMLEHFSQSES